MKKAICAILLAVLLCLCGIVGWGLWENTALQVTTLRIANASLPEGFEGFRIAQVSDLHDASFGSGNEALLDALAESRPDIIVITGDLVDSRNTDVEVALSFAEKAAAIAPVYYCTGNHEERLNDYDAFKSSLQAVGVTVLENEKIALERDGQMAILAGIDDPNFMSNDLYGSAEYMTSTRLERLELSDEYTILLSHRPELLQVYAQFGIDLVFAGHAHGGQVRLGQSGIFAPHQGFFPAYTEGLHQAGSTTMVVSRGLGNSLFPFRLNNPPELVVAVLVSE